MNVTKDHLCMNCHKVLHYELGHFCSVPCSRQYAKLSHEARKAAFYSWRREMIDRLDWDNDELGWYLQIDLFLQRGDQNGTSNH